MDRPNIEEFRRVCMGMVAPPLERYGFQWAANESGECGPGLYHESIVFRDGAGSHFVAAQLMTITGVGCGQWIQILLGEGGLDSDSHVSIWQMTDARAGSVDTTPYSVHDGWTIAPALAFALERLLTDGEGFLKGDLATFRQARQLLAAQEEHTRAEEGRRAGED